MSFSKRTVKDIDVKNKKVLLRTMLNAPIKNGRVTDTARLTAAKPTVDYLLKQGAAIILISHHSSPGQSLEPVAKVLHRVFKHPVKFIDESTGHKVDRAIQALKPLDILVLENLRFHPEEEANDQDFAKTLANYADEFVQDDFTTCHRKHASMVGVPKYLEAVAGLSVVNEVETINKAIEKPKRPLVVVTGGAKVSTKIPILSYLLKSVDHVLIGGAMANTFLLAQGRPIGKSLAEPDQTEAANAILEDAKAQGKDVLLPIDVVVTDNVETPGYVRTVMVEEVTDQDIIVDLGPMTIDQLNGVMKPEGTIIWNGPIGVAENTKFASGTKYLTDKIISSQAFSVIGGGDTLAFVDDSGIHDLFDFVSTGGGASLELMSGNKLPGVEALLEAK